MTGANNICQLTPYNESESPTNYGSKYAKNQNFFRRHGELMEICQLTRIPRFPIPDSNATLMAPWQLEGRRGGQPGRE